MKLVIRSLVLGIAVSGLAASALTAHMGNNAALANNHAATMMTSPVVAAMPIPLCDPSTNTSCGIQSGMKR
ncbi:MAG: hypothetical protein ACP5M4_06930 [Acidobacteriaceae bacterium]